MCEGCGEERASFPNDLEGIDGREAPMVRCLRQAWGAIVEMEPSSHLPYSNNYKPDVVIKGQGKSGVRLVGDLKLFDPLSAGERALLLGSLTTVPVATNEIVIRQGDKGDTFYIVKSGAVEVRRLYLDLP